MPSLIDRLKHSWNAFLGRDPTVNTYGIGTMSRPDRVYLKNGSERSIVTTVYNKIAVDASQIDIEHVKIDSDKHYLETIDSSLNECLTVSANLDQTGRKFIQDLVMNMCDEGYVAAVIIDADNNPRFGGSYNIQSMRVGKIVEWYPYEVKVEVYNERTGKREQLTFPKSITAIIENPFYEIMNRPNSTAQRLIRTLAELDLLNKSKSSGKLDVIIQLPYIAKTKTRQEQAAMRREALEEQMEKSKLGIGYIDGTERIIQLNRPLENNLWKQAQDLTDQLYSQLGLTPEVFNGTADPKVMAAYYSRTINPILTAITEEMTRKFISKRARSMGQAVRFYRNPFELLPVTDIAEIADKLTRNEIVSSNELRSELGYKPRETTRADELLNKNIKYPIQNGEESTESESEDDTTKEFNDVMAQLDQIKRDANAVTMSHSDAPKRKSKKARGPTPYIPGDKKKRSELIKEYLKERKGVE